jgi:hypothetical protein
MIATCISVRYYKKRNITYLYYKIKHNKKIIRLYAIGKLAKDAYINTITDLVQTKKL